MPKIRSFLKVLTSLKEILKSEFLGISLLILIEFHECPKYYTVCPDILKKFLLEEVIWKRSSIFYEGKLIFCCWLCCGFEVEFIDRELNNLLTLGIN